MANLGLGRVSVCNRAAPWWDARHDLCLVRGVTKHGTLASEQRRVDVLEDASLGWPDDMPRPPPRLDVEPADADEVASNAPSQAPSWRGGEGQLADKGGLSSVWDRTRQRAERTHKSCEAMLKKGNRASTALLRRAGAAALRVNHRRRRR